MAENNIEGQELSLLISALQNVVTAINNATQTLDATSAQMVTSLNSIVVDLGVTNSTLADINTQISISLPGGNALSGSAGLASGQYLSVLVGGTPYKMALLLP